MKLDVVVERGSLGNDLVVKNVQIRPISDLIPCPKTSENNILIRPHQLNIKEFYESVRSNFWNSTIDPGLSSDWPYLIPESMSDLENKYIKTWDDTYWAGTQRMSHDLYGTTHEVMIPLWLEKCNGLRINLGFYGGDSLVHSCYLTIRDPNLVPNESETFHTRFCNYILNYFDHIGILSGNNKVLRVQFSDNVFTLSGLDVTSGNYLIRNDYNITRNLISRERPLLEFNSMLTNSFRDYNMIVPQMMVFNICFNPKDVVPKSVYNLLLNTRVRVKTIVEILEDEDSENWEEIPKCDIFTNHQYIPRIDASKRYPISSSYFTEPTKNALDYLSDYLITDIMHHNKIVQPICHWCISESPSILFNVYDGFGAYKSTKGYGYKHVYGNTPDPYLGIKDSNMDNTTWVTNLKLTSSSIESIFGSGTTEPDYDTILEYEEAGLFKSLSGYVNGYKFTYSGGTYSGYNINEVKLGVVKISSGSTYSIVASEGDDCYYGSDSLSDDATLYYYLIISTGVLYILIITNNSSSDETSILYKNILEYLEGIVDTSVGGNFAGGSTAFYYAALLNALKTLQPWDVVYFNKSIELRPDTSITPRAGEKNCYMLDDINEYVYRYSENIKPAMYTTRVVRDSSGNLGYSMNYGRNYLWLKDKYRLSEILELDSDYRSYEKYLYSGIAPTFPSLKYECVNTYFCEYPSNEYGDLIYDEILPVFDGYNMRDGVTDNGLGSWAEYKWFDESRILISQESFTFEDVYVLDNDDEILLNYAINRIYEEIGLKDLDEYKIQQLYNFNYEIQGIVRDYPSIINSDVITWGELNGIYGDNSPGFSEEYVTSNYADSNGKILLYKYAIEINLK